MKDVGSANYVPQAHRNATVAIHRAERAVEKDSVAVARTPVVESHTTVESRGTNEAVLDARHQLLYMKAGAKIVSTSDEMSKTLLYTHEAARITTSSAEESRTLLDIRV